MLDNSEKKEIKLYNIFRFDEIECERQKKIEEFIQISDLPKSQAELVLMNNKWDIDSLMNEWFDNTQKIKEKSGISQTEESEKRLKEYFEKNNIKDNCCLVCELEIIPEDKINLDCGHQFCYNCFKEYLKEKAKDQLKLLETKCPMKGCNYQVPSQIFKNIFEKDKKQLSIYNKCLMRNFTESNADFKLCPNPKCELIIQLPGHGMNDIKCNCGNNFCFNCLRESHVPSDCYLVEEWEKKMKNKEEKIKLLTFLTKQCPSCGVLIEKNQGCNHMVCKCKYEFCWVCLGAWKEHECSWYECKRPNQNNNSLNDTELERYAEFYQSYQEEENTIKYAKELREKIHSIKSELNKILLYSEIKFLDEAINTVIECHQFLKNAYIIGYWMKKDEKIITLYLYTLNNLRMQTDLLHELIEMDYLNTIIKIKELKEFHEQFNYYRANVMTHTTIVKKYKNNIIKEIEQHPEYIYYNS